MDLLQRFCDKRLKGDGKREEVFAWGFAEAQCGDKNLFRGWGSDQGLGGSDQGLGEGVHGLTGVTGEGAGEIGGDNQEAAGLA